ncbi:hypothetical protein AB834_01045 [PVC group bacterium (ex Bugula neritina AB1)]|nr:hypothetical protein AB834_01045 [PVC group bacterium (ex Bugula neritina AB1)]
MEIERKNNFSDKILELSTKAQKTSLSQFIRFCDGSFDIQKFSEFKESLLETLKPSSVAVKICQLKGVIRKATELSSSFNSSSKIYD